MPENKVNRTRRRLYEALPEEELKNIEKNISGLSSETSAKEHGIKTSASKQSEANKIIKKYILYSMGLGLIPIPVADLIFIMSLQLKMLYDISKIYEIEFSASGGKSIISSLISGITIYSVGDRTIGSLVKAIPGLGTILGITVVPAASGAATYALGKVFIQHYESGGTFLNFDPETVRKHFKQLYENEKKSTDKINIL